jgi:protease I
MKDLTGKKVAILIDNYFEESEFTEPLNALRRAGATVEIVAAESENGKVQSMKHVDKGRFFPIDKKLSQANIKDYDALVLPGGAINSDGLRMQKKAREWVRSILKQEKPLAVICHAPWILVSAGMAKGRKLTSFFSIQDDMIDAGANWVDEEVVIDGSLITSRNPDDLPAFNKALIAMIAA